MFFELSRFLPLLLASATLCAAVPACCLAAEEPTPRDDSRFVARCGDPRLESSVWIVVEGTVVEVWNGDTISILTDKDHRKVWVHLAAVRAPDADTDEGKEAARVLTRLVLNRHAEVLIRFEDSGKDSVTAMVSVPGQDVALRMIELGLVRHRTPEPYTMSNFADCTYRVVEGEAKAQRRGVWKSDPFQPSLPAPR